MNITAQALYKKLHKISKQTAIFNSMHCVLEWDQETYMPSNAIDFRSSQMEELSHLIHKHQTSTKFRKALAALIDLETGQVTATGLTHAQTSALREWRRDYNNAVKLPASFVRKFSKTTSQGIHAWTKAKKGNRFSLFAPHLEKIVTLCRKKADFLGFKHHPYDALLDLYEPGMTTATLSPLFGKLQTSLTSLLKYVQTKPPSDRSLLDRHLQENKQIEFCHDILKAMGFREGMYRLDLSAHPFCTGIHPTDTRMTTRILTNNFMSSISASMHEGGHGLYNMGRPAAEFGTPLCDNASLSMDESQSRFWETRIGLSLPFWHHFFPKLQEKFPDELKHIKLQDFYRAINAVEPSFIRIEADEVTYSLHIILRFEIERALIEGSLQVKDLPEAWNEKMHTYFGISPPTDAEGCLQDIHWSMGGIGYFPTYTLGNLYAAQFFEVFETAYPNWKEKLERGDLSFVRNWLYEHIHKWGREYTPEELVKRITGKALSEEAFVKYLNGKFRALYH